MDYFLDNFIVFVQNLLQLLKLLLIEYIYLVFKFCTLGTNNTLSNNKISQQKLLHRARMNGLATTGEYINDESNSSSLYIKNYKY